MNPSMKMNANLKVTLELIREREIEELEDDYRAMTTDQKDHEYIEQMFKNLEGWFAVRND